MTPARTQQRTIQKRAPLQGLVGVERHYRRGAFRIDAEGIS